MAAALPATGHIDTCELDPERAAVAQSHIDRSPWAHLITVHVGPAGETIDRLTGTFDLVFLDAEKDGYVDYYEAVLPRLSEHGLLVADNTLYGGRVFEPGNPIATFNEHVAADAAERAGSADRPRRDDADPPRLNDHDSTIVWS